MAQILQLRRDTTTNWTAANPVLALGEFGYDTVLKQHKIGDGVTAWNSLSFDGVGPAGTPGTAGVAGSAVISFGSFPGTNEASVIISSPTILATSIPNAYLAAVATSDHTVSDHTYAQGLVALSVGAIIAGVGFTIYATCEEEMEGTFNVNWNWV